MNPRTLTWIFAITLLTTLHLPGQTPAQHRRYKLIDLGTLGGTFSDATAVTPAGEIVGESATAGNAEEHAFSWQAKDGMVDLGTLGGSFSEARATTASGDVVGGSVTATGEFHATLWQSHP